MGLQTENSLKTESDEEIGNDGKSPKARIGAVMSRRMINIDRPRNMHTVTKERKLNDDNSLETPIRLPSHLMSDPIMSQTNALISQKASQNRNDIPFDFIQDCLRINGPLP